MEKFSNNVPQNAEKRENKIEKPQIKEGVDFAFEQNPELAQIGTKEQYSEYLDTIFPNSKVRDIVYHASSNKIEKFRDNMFGAYFSYSPIQGVYGDVINNVLLNIKSLLMKPKPEYSTEEKVIYDKEYRSYNNPSFSPEGDRIYKYDASVENSTVTKEGVQIKVRNPEQIYILGSKQDIENFKKFVANENET
ncbi:MAG: hypothetical protein PHE20_00475 [Patescibacteria group bacterium]|nr:hypothetical protein [Patescibacteria group bacterium]